MKYRKTRYHRRESLYHNILNSCFILDTHHQDKRKRNTEQGAFKSTWLADDKQAHVEYDEKQIVFYHTEKEIQRLIPTLEMNGIESERVSEFKNRYNYIIQQNVKLCWYTR